MKLFLDYLPIICFFIAYKIWGIYIATGVAIGVLLIQVAYQLIRHKKVETTQWINLILLVVLGGATLIFHKSIFIKWKVSVVYWAFGVALLGAKWIKDVCLIKSLMGKQLTAPDKVWNTLTYAWASFFIVMGFVNMYVMYHYTTAQWVNFKLFGTLGLLIVFCVAQAFYLNPYVSTDEKKDDDKK
jgi:intracellular septation protein